MVLMGRANWWLPRWLDRILPRIQVEGPPAAPHLVSDDIALETSAPERVLVSAGQR
jgi:uncharacterized membrane protein YdfJ with MMPL/SSD domain